MAKNGDVPRWNRNLTPKQRAERAERIIEDLRSQFAELRTDGAPSLVELRLRDSYGIEPLVACEGEAHGNPFIDNCTLCMPQWGWRDPSKAPNES